MLNLIAFAIYAYAFQQFLLEKRMITDVVQQDKRKMFMHGLIAFAKHVFALQRVLLVKHQQK